MVLCTTAAKSRRTVRVFCNNAEDNHKPAAGDGHDGRDVTGELAELANFLSRVFLMLGGSFHYKILKAAVSSFVYFYRVLRSS